MLCNPPNPEDFVKPEGKSVYVPTEEDKHNALDVKSEIPSDDAKLTIPEGKESNPRDFLRDERVEPNDSVSVIPNEPDSPRQPDPIVQAPNQGAGPQQGNNQHPGDLSEILNNHEAEARARNRVRAGISLWQYAMGHSSAEPT